MGEKRSTTRLQDAAAQNLQHLQFPVDSIADLFGQNCAVCAQLVSHIGLILPIIFCCIHICRRGTDIANYFFLQILAGAKMYVHLVGS
jgi:hypothetical protein